MYSMYWLIFNGFWFDTMFYKISMIGIALLVQISRGELSENLFDLGSIHYDNVFLFSSIALEFQSKICFFC